MEEITNNYLVILMDLKKQKEQAKPLDNRNNPKDISSNLKKLNKLLIKILKVFPTDQNTNNKLLPIALIRGGLDKNINGSSFKGSIEELKKGINQLSAGLPSIITEQKRLVDLNMEQEISEDYIERLYHLYNDTINLISNQFDKEKEKTITKISVTNFVHLIFKLLDRPVRINKIKKCVTRFINEEIEKSQKSQDVSKTTHYSPPIQVNILKEKIKAKPRTKKKK